MLEILIYLIIGGVFTWILTIIEPPPKDVPWGVFVICVVGWPVILFALLFEQLTRLRS